MAEAVLLAGLGDGVVQDQFGNALNSRLVYVYKRGTTTQVQVYSDSGLSLPLTQPLTTGGGGTQGGIPGYVSSGQSLDFVDVVTGVKTQAEAWSAVAIGMNGGTGTATVGSASNVNTGEFLVSTLGGYAPDGSAIPNQGTPISVGISTGDLYADSSGGNIFQIASYVSNSGSRATVAVFGESTNALAGWGSNFVAYSSIANATSIGCELDFGVLGNSANCKSYGLVLARKGGTTGGATDGSPYIQMQASSNAASNTGIYFHGTGTTAPISSAGTLIKADAGLSANIGIDISGATFGDSALKVGGGNAVKVGTTVLGRSDRIANGLYSGIGWAFWNVPDPAPYSTSVAAPASGTVYAVKMPLFAGDVVNNLSAFCSNAGSGVSHCWFMLLDSGRHVLRTTADLGAPAATFQSSAVQDGNGNNAPYTVSADGDYYFAILSTFSTSALQFRGVNSSTEITNQTSGTGTLSGSSTTGLTSGAPPISTLNGAQTFPQGTTTLNSTTGFPSGGGTVSIAGVTGDVTYGAVSGATLTGCTGGVGAAANGAIVGLKLASITGNGAVFLVGGT